MSSSGIGDSVGTSDESDISTAEGILAVVVSLSA